MNSPVDWKYVVLSRWGGEYQPAAENDTNVVLKSSQEIADDLRGAGEFSADEVSMFLAVRGYRIVFEGGYPYWALKNNVNDKMIDG